MHSLPRHASRTPGTVRSTRRSIIYARLWRKPSKPFTPDTPTKLTFYLDASLCAQRDEFSHYRSAGRNGKPERSHQFSDEDFGVARVGVRQGSLKTSDEFYPYRISYTRAALLSSSIRVKAIKETRQRVRDPIVYCGVYLRKQRNKPGQKRTEEGIGM